MRRRSDGTAGGRNTAGSREQTCPGADNAEKPVAEKPVSEGRKAEYARERACGKEWKADKAAGKI